MACLFMSDLLDRILWILALAAAISLAPAACHAAEAESDLCQTNWREQRRVAKRLREIRYQMDVLWPQGTPCNKACERLQREASGLLDEQLRLEVLAEALHCPLDGET